MDERGPGNIPERWLRCPRKSNNLIVGKFLAFKTPLDDRYDNQIPPGDRFPPSMLFQIMKSYKVKLGLWVDLTNTTRFYNKEEIEKEGCKYLKLQCRGHGEAPSKEQTEAFIKICHRYISMNPLDTIGVHCTHGFNRTGFLIVSYLVEKMDLSLDAALRELILARPPGIYKPDYIKELFERYDDVEAMGLAPERPDWCYEDDDGNDGDEDFDDSSSGFSSERSDRRRERNKKNPVFMEGVPGVTVVREPMLSNVQRKAQDICLWEGTGFPGSQPVSMDKTNIERLAEMPYKVSWKADGTRYMMLILRRNEIFFLDRDNSVFRVEGLSFPLREEGRHLENTLLDGEMVIDIFGQERIPRYLIYDIISFSGNHVASKPFYPDRYKHIKDFIVQPRNDAVMKGRLDKAKEPFSIRLKEFWDITTTEYLLGEKFAKKLSHEPDGLIFQPVREEYVTGPSVNCLKWKPSTHNSVDFRLKIVKEEGEGIVSRKVGLLFAGGLKSPYGKMKYCKAIKDLDNKIIECKTENHQWVFMRERTDKSFPNSKNTADAVVKSILDPVTKEYLLQFIKERRWTDADRNLMPPPSKRMCL